MKSFYESSLALWRSLSSLGEDTKLKAAQEVSENLEVGGGLLFSAHLVSFFLTDDSQFPALPQLSGDGHTHLSPATQGRYGALVVVATCS